MDEIPKDVLALAEEAYQEAIYMTASDEPKNMVDMVARAILAERERCAALFDARPKDPWSAEAVAATIRNPTSPAA